MKKLLFVLLVAFTATIVSAQRGNERNDDSNENTESFNRKGRVLIETGYNLIGGLPIGGGTGITSISDGDISLSGIGFNGGYFVSQNFALKLSISNLGDSDVDISSFGVGVKYYIAGKVPIDLILGTLSAGNGNDGDSTFNTLSVGYGIRLADNINLEPSIGIFSSEDGDSSALFRLNFAMFL